MLDLTGQKALVCGSTQGIGRATANLLARQGATVTLLARNPAALAAVAAELPRPANQTHQWQAADFAATEALRRAAEQALAASGGFDILVNNTGGPAPGPVLEADVDAFRRAFEMHVLGNQVLVQTLTPHMKARRYGRIIQIISTSVREPIPGIGVSNTTRWAVAAWAKTLSRELAPFGITVNNVLPGFTDTDRLKELFESRAAREGVPYEAVVEQARKGVPMGRFATIDEIAAAVAFLASREASYVTGINLPVDGGRLNSM